MYAEFTDFVWLSVQFKPDKSTVDLSGLDYPLLEERFDFDYYLSIQPLHHQINNIFSQFSKSINFPTKNQEVQKGTEKEIQVSKK